MSLFNDESKGGDFSVPYSYGGFRGICRGMKPLVELLALISQGDSVAAVDLSNFKMNVLGGFAMSYCFSLLHLGPRNNCRLLLSGSAVHVILNTVELDLCFDLV